MRAAPINLTDDTGRPWSLEDHRGSGQVVFFGYTHCKDTCPLTLAKLSKALFRSRAETAEVEFITVDPERDTPPVLHAYLKRFAGKFRGLTGSRAQIEAVERSYHVWAQKLPGKHGDDDYDDAHTSTVFLIDRAGNIASLHDVDDSVGTLARAIATL